MGGAIVRLLRPKQWTKNLLVFAPMLVTRQYASWLDAVLAFVAMCLVGSAMYALNDILDVKRDRAHPSKKKRPIAAGQISTQVAWVICIICLGAGVAVAFASNVGVVFGVSIYVLVQVLYNFWLKRVVIADVFAVGFGFVLRAAIGAVAIDVTISVWLLFVTGALAVLIGFAKRRSEFVSQGEQRSASRPVLADYSLQILDAFVIVTATITILSYALYSIESDTARAYPLLPVSALFVSYGVLRYLYLVFSRNEGGEPESLIFADPQLVMSIALTILSIVAATWLGGQIG